MNEQDDFGNTSLYYAIDLKNPLIIRLLLTNHADIKIKNSEGKSALDLAHEIGDKSILNIISNPIPVSTNEINDEKDHDPCDNYEEIKEYLTPYIKNKNFHKNYKITPYIMSRMNNIFKSQNVNVFKEMFGTILEINHRQRFYSDLNANINYILDRL